MREAKSDMGEKVRRLAWAEQEACRSAGGAGGVRRGSNQPQKTSGRSSSTGDTKLETGKTCRADLSRQEDETVRQKEKETETETERQRDRETETETETETGTGTEKGTETEADLSRPSRDLSASHRSPKCASTPDLEIRGVSL